jgi:uncharacterized tellurite resistance protein B-like protein
VAILICKKSPNFRTQAFFARRETKSKCNMESQTLTKNQFPDTATIEEYIAYLYLAIAGADLNISDKEFYKIGRRISGLLVQHFPETKFEFKTLLRTVRSVVEKKSPSEYKKVIETLNKKYHLPVDIQMDIIADLHELINIDDFIDQSEYALINFIKVCFVEK